MQKSIYTILFLIILISCNKTKKTEDKKINKLDWLVGSWENNAISGNLSEIWEKLNDSTFTGQAYFIKGNDTLHNENIVLNQTDDDVFYIPTVKGQNNDKPVTFKLTLSTEKQFVFENPTHDYPQKIVYNQITADSLVVEISGMVGGKANSEQYPMKKK